jgi:hypothetical protein
MSESAQVSEIPAHFSYEQGTQKIWSDTLKSKKEHMGMYAEYEEHGALKSKWLRHEITKRTEFSVAFKRIDPFPENVKKVITVHSHPFSDVLHMPNGGVQIPTKPPSPGDMDTDFSATKIRDHTAPLLPTESVVEHLGEYRFGLSNPAALKKEFSGHPFFNEELLSAREGYLLTKSTKDMMTYNSLIRNAHAVLLNAQSTFSGASGMFPATADLFQSEHGQKLWRAYQAAAASFGFAVSYISRPDLVFVDAATVKESPQQKDVK